MILLKRIYGTLRSNPNKEEALLAAALSGDINTVNEIICQGVNVNKIAPSSCETSLMRASASRYSEVVKALLSQGAKVNLRDKWGNTALTRALFSTVDRKPEDVVALLLGRGANPNVRDQNGNTPLTLALEYGHFDSVPLLIDGGADPNMPNRYILPLQIALKRFEEGAAKTAELLIRAGANIEEKSDCEWSLLGMCIDNHYTSAAKFLISHGANVNATASSNGCKPLHHACFDERNMELVEILIGNGADINATDNIGNTPLHYAKEGAGRPKLAAFLESKGALAQVSATQK